MSNFKITKALIEAYVNNGFTVKMMAEDVTKQSGVKCSSATVTHACKTYGVNLRNKKNPSHFILEDLDAASPIAKAMNNSLVPQDASNATLVNPLGTSYAQVEEPTVTL